MDMELGEDGELMDVASRQRHLLGLEEPRTCRYPTVAVPVYAPGAILINRTALLEGETPCNCTV
jgi:hypothetical protein